MNQIRRLRTRLKTPEMIDIFRYVEWMTIAVFAFVLWLSPNLAAYEAIAVLPLWSAYIALGGLFGLSLVFPAQWKSWQRRLYIASEFGLIVIILLAGLGLEFLLYVVIAKSCFLLGRRDLLILLVAIGIIWNSLCIWMTQRSLAVLQNRQEDLINLSQQSFASGLVASIGLYIVICTFVLLLSFTILREQRSRARAEQLAAEVEVLAATVERSRIAREIHDSLGHRLTTLDVQLELAQRLQGRDGDRCAQSISIAKQLAAQCLQDVRHAVHSMGKQNFDLNRAIQELVQPMSLSSLATINPQFPPLPPTLSHQIYCIVQEGLTNIQRHSKATKVVLEGGLKGNCLMLKLRDNGIGFNLDRANLGFGLRSMTERAQIVGGQLQIQSIPGEGTELYLEIPIV
jgi:signal transduction histidine kinase